ncbi:hypothetical protein HK098_002309 [Nowakowskiella sp. JEL0407]|nr:hypothetical protein HK098_002309 [Nowakowskiella sp. JEL0407]
MNEISPTVGSGSDTMSNANLSSLGFYHVLEAFDQWHIQNNFAGLDQHQSPFELFDKIKNWLPEKGVSIIPSNNVIVKWMVVIGQKYPVVKRWLENWETTPARIASQRQTDGQGSSSSSETAEIDASTISNSKERPATQAGEFPRKIFKNCFVNVVIEGTQPKKRGPPKSGRGPGRPPSLKIPNSEPSVSSPITTVKPKKSLSKATIQDDPDSEPIANLVSRGSRNKSKQAVGEYSSPAPGMQQDAPSPTITDAGDSALVNQSNFVNSYRQIFLQQQYFQQQQSLFKSFLEPQGKPPLDSTKTLPFPTYGYNEFGGMEANRPNPFVFPPLNPHGMYGTPPGNRLWKGFPQVDATARSSGPSTPTRASEGNNLFSYLGGGTANSDGYRPQDHYNAFTDPTATHRLIQPTHQYLQELLMPFERNDYCDSSNSTEKKEIPETLEKLPPYPLNLPPPGYVQPFNQKVIAPHLQAAYMANCPCGVHPPSTFKDHGLHPIITSHCFLDIGAAKVLMEHGDLKIKPYNVNKMFDRVLKHHRDLEQLISTPGAWTRIAKKRTNGRKVHLKKDKNIGIKRTQPFKDLHYHQQQHIEQFFRKEDGSNLSGSFDNFGSNETLVDVVARAAEPCGSSSYPKANYNDNMKPKFHQNGTSPSLFSDRYHPKPTVPTNSSGIFSQLTHANEKSKPISNVVPGFGSDQLDRAASMMIDEYSKSMSAAQQWAEVRKATCYKSTENFMRELTTLAEIEEDRRVYGVNDNVGSYYDSFDEKIYESEWETEEEESDEEYWRHILVSGIDCEVGAVHF